MKWIFLLGLILLVPTLTAVLRGNPRMLRWVAYAIGVIPFLMEPFHLIAAPISWAMWQGPVKGIEISLLDAVAVSILLVTRPVRMPLGPKIGLGFIAAGLLISTALAHALFPCSFYAWQLARTVLVAVAVARLTAASKEAPIAILWGMGTALVALALYATWQHLHGVVQAGGFLGHQNTTGLVSHFATFPAFALLLANRRTALALLVLVAEILIVYAGGSRGTIFLFAIGLATCAVLSIRHRHSGRKAAIMAAFAVIGLVATPVMMAAIDRRPEAELKSSNTERRAFETAARLMIADHPLGVGSDRYVLVANIGGYSDKADVPWNGSERGAPVHNSWLLITAELGFLGLIGFLIMISTTIWTGVRALSRLEHGERSELLVGTTTALIIASLHAYFEWVPMTFPFHYLFAVDAGILFGIASFAKAKVSARHPTRAPEPVYGTGDNVLA